MVEEKCKVCGKPLSLADIFCPVCGVEHHILPEPVSEEVRRYEEKRIKAYKKAWEEHNQGVEKFKKNYEAEVSKNKTLEHNLNDVKTKIAAAEQEKGHLKSQADKAQKELALVKKEKQGLVDKVHNLTSQNMMLINEKDIVLEELEKAKNTKQLLGIVIVTDMVNDFHAVAPINPGVNTFGSEVSNDNHHMVRLGPFSIQLIPKHFSVESIGKHFLLKDMTGGAMNLPVSGMYVEGKTIKLNNSIEVKFLKIL